MHQIQTTSSAAACTVSIPVCWKQSRLIHFLTTSDVTLNNCLSALLCLSCPRLCDKKLSVEIC